MTVYVDQALIQAEVVDSRIKRKYKSKWCHLFSGQIDSAELHAFAVSTGLRREWFQAGTAPGRPDVVDPVRGHFDLTHRMRQAAVRAGAVSVDMVEAVEIWRVKRALVGGRL